MAFNLEELRKCLQESNITISTRRYTIKLTSVEAFDPRALKIPSSYAKIEQKCRSDFIDSKIDRKGEDSKIFLLTDENGSNEELFLRMKDDNSGKLDWLGLGFIHYKKQLLCKTIIFYSSLLQLIEKKPEKTRIVSFI